MSRFNSSPGHWSCTIISSHLETSISDFNSAITFTSLNKNTVVVIT
ncbi:MAG: hypothetical protein AAGC65_08315 [Mucilaginibacter sp.]